MQIYISGWSLRQTLTSSQVDLAGLPSFVREQGYDGIEVTDRQLAHASPETLDALADGLIQARLGIILDINCDLSLPEGPGRQSQIEHITVCLRQAKELGANLVRITLGGQALSLQKLLARKKQTHKVKKDDAPTGGGLLSHPLLRQASHLLRVWQPLSKKLPETQLDRAVAQLQQLLPVAESLNIRLAIENHWGISSRPEWILYVVDAIDSTWLGTCVDFANFPRSIDRYQAIAALMPRALLVQAKSFRFNAQGEETSIDYARALGAVTAAGYDDIVTIEYEGGQDELENCSKTRDIVRRYTADSSHRG